MRGKIHTLAMLSAFVGLTAFMIQEVEARGGRGGYGGSSASRGGYGQSGFSRGGSYSRPSGGYSRPTTRPGGAGGVGSAGRPGGVGGVGGRASASRGGAEPRAEPVA